MSDAKQPPGGSHSSATSDASLPSTDDWHDMLSRFAVASEVLVASRQLRSRTDAKFLMAPSSAMRLVMSLSAEYARLPAGRAVIASYRTLYFDTAALDLFHAHRRGRRVRHKVRIRHYPDRLLSVLEVKTRRSELETTKTSRERSYGDGTLSTADQTFVRAHSGIIDEVFPQVWTEYRRVTLLGICTNERITIDLDLTVRMGERARSFSDVAVIEVKQWPSHRRTPIMSALRTAGCRQLRVSKYCAALAFVRPTLRRNRLLPGLRALERGMT